jgi:hypothetical protein
MIRIAAEHIYVLRNSTGKPFTDLLDRLIRSYAWTLGIPPSAVLDNPRTNHPDGGVDTQVTLGAPDPWGYFNGASTWQYKAVELKDLTDSKVKCPASTILSPQRQLEFPTDCADSFSPSLFSPFHA